MRQRRGFGPGEDHNWHMVGHDLLAAAGQRRDFGPARITTAVSEDRASERLIGLILYVPVGWNVILSLSRSRFAYPVTLLPSE